MAFFVASCIFVVLLFVGPAAGFGSTPLPQPLPSEGQLFVQELGLSQFMHFSVNPFSESTQHNCVNGTGVDAPPCLPAALFNPTNLSTDQWVETAVTFGAKEICLTAHHEGGFALWDTAYTNYSVMHSPYGKDVVAQFVKSCAKHNVKPCYYFPPNANGWLMTHNASREEFERVQMGQMTELLTKYDPPPSRLWWDHYGDDGTEHCWEPGTPKIGPNPVLCPYGTFPADWKRFIALARKLSPTTMLCPGPDCVSGYQHVGFPPYPVWLPCNEKNGKGMGCKLEDHWMPGSANLNPAQQTFGALTYSGSMHQGWFCNGDCLQGKFWNATRMWQTYVAIVGIGRTATLNAPPGTTGQIVPELADAMAQFGRKMKELMKPVTPSAIQYNLTSTTCDNTVVGELHLGANGGAGEYLINAIMTKEDLARGQRITSYALDYQEGGGPSTSWIPFKLGNFSGPNNVAAEGVHGLSVGARIIDFVPPTRAKKVRFRCLSAAGGNVYLSSFSAHSGCDAVGSCFNYVPPNASDLGRRLQAAVNSSIAAGADTLTIAPGTYRFDSVDLMVDGARDLTIAAGAESSPSAASGPTVSLLFTCNWGVVLRSCVNVSLRGVTVDYDPPCFSQGNVTAPPTAQSNTTLTYTVEDGFPVPDLVAHPRFASARVKVRMWKPDGHGDWKPWAGSTDCSSISARHLGGRSYEITNSKQWSIAPTGLLRVTLAPRSGHTLLLTNCSRCLIEGVTVLGTSDMALVDYGGGGANVWRGNRVTRGVGRLLASNADMFQTVGGAERGPVVEGNVLESANDDCMNIHNYFSVILKTDGTQVLVADAVGEADATAANYSYHQQLNTFGQAVPGDVLRVYDWANLSLRLTTTMRGSRESMDPADLVLANSVYKALKINRNWAGVVRVYWVTLRDALPAAAGQNPVINLDRLSGAGAIVRNNTFSHCTGVRFKSIGGLFTGNRLEAVRVTVNTWQEWGEGSAGLRDIVVANNTFVFCSQAPPYVTQGLGNTNVTIVNNTVVCVK